MIRGLTVRPKQEKDVAGSLKHQESNKPRFYHVPHLVSAHFCLLEEIQQETGHKKLLDFTSYDFFLGPS